MAENVLEIPLSSKVEVQVSEDRNIALVNGAMHSTDSYGKLSKAIMTELGFEPPKRKPRKKKEEEPAAEPEKKDEDLDLG